MSTVILRRRNLGRTSCREIARLSTQDIQVIRNWVPTDVAVMPNDENHSIIRWGCTSSLSEIDIRDGRVFNKTSAIHWCSDKKASRLELQESGIIVPVTWDSFESWCEPGRDLNIQYVARPRTHSRGRDFIVTADAYVIQMFNQQHHNDIYISELIDKVAEYRVMVIQGRVAWVARKTPGNPEDVAWNVARGGRFDNVRWGDWPLNVCQEALEAASISDTDFCGVDVMVDITNTAFVLEVNSAPSLTSPYRQQCTAKCFDWMIQNNLVYEPINYISPLLSSEEGIYTGNWRDFVHPALLRSNRS